MEKITTIRTIPLEYEYLGAKILDKIGEKLQKMIGECSREYGYITEILEYHIVDSEIARATTEALFKVCIDIHALKPVVGEIYKCSVASCIGGNGIYAVCSGKLRIRIGEKSLINFQFVNGDYKNGDRVIKVGMDIQVRVSAIKYENTREHQHCHGQEN